MTLAPRTCAPQNMYILDFQRRGSLHLSPRQSQTHSSQNYLISSASIPNPMAQEFLHPSARQNAMKWSVGMIILLLVRICCLIGRVIATMSYSMYQLTHTQARPQVYKLIRVPLSL